MKINKAAAADTASMLFQSAYSGRAEFGLAGDDNWHVKVSPDGLAWTEALLVDAASGRVTLPAGLPLDDSNQIVARRHVREKLTANRSYYVRSDGADGNSGLIDSAGGAFLTLQKAWDVIVTLDLAGFTATISVGAGTFAAGLTADVPPVGGNVTVNGAGAGTVISITSGNGCIVNNTLCNITVQNMKLTGTAGAGVRAVGKGAKITLGTGVEFGANLTADIWAQGGTVSIGSNYTKSGNAQRHYHAQNGGLIEAFLHTVTMSGTPAFSIATASALGASVLSIFNVTYSGAATGTRYSASLNGVINTFGGGLSFLPGNAVGSSATGGQYV